MNERKDSDPAGVVLAAYPALRGARVVDELFSRAADLAPAVCGFDRAVVASVRDGRLTTAGSRRLEDPASDELRRQLLAHPVLLQPGSLEAEYVRHARRTRPGRRQSDLVKHLGLGRCTFAAIAPENTTVALLMVDRADGLPTAADLARVDAFAGIVEITLDQLLLRRRVADLAQEIRQFAGTAQALAREAVDAAPALSGDYVPDGQLLGGGGQTGDAVDLMALLSDKEQPVARLLAQGCSNREIALAVTVSPETVKSQVASILRKLHVANRVEAAAVLLRASR